ncbi:MAG: serine hydrolase [Gammaproteobacteria bacterium]|nr:serine hydrolase [Gammaproteobacteria bacterium]
MKYIVLLVTLTCSPSVLGDIQAWTELTDELKLAQHAADVPAMGLVIMDHSQPALVSAWGEAITAQTPFRWGSISKTFTALALLRLAEQGKVTLTDPVSRFLPANTFNNPWAAQQPLLLLHLLELSGGFSDLSGAEFVLKQPLSLAAALAVSPTTRIAHWPPGLQTSYTNVNPGITAAVIEQVSGQSFEEFARTEVLWAMGMGSASFHPVPGLPGGFKADGRTEIPYWHMIFRAFGGLNASLEEMSRFLTMLLNDGQIGDRRIFARKTLAGLFRPRSGLAAEAGLEIGYGTGAYGWVSHGHVFYGHGGDADGYRARYGLLPGAGRGYLIVINTDNRALLRRLQKSIEFALTTDLPKADPLAAVVEPRSVLESYAGDYYPSSARFGIKRWQAGEAPPVNVSLSEQGLVFDRNGRRIPLIPLGAGKFRRPTDPVATVIFARDSAGTLYLQGELGNFVSLKSAPCPGFIPVCI